MNRKQFIVLLVLVLVLGGAAWWHYRRQTAGWQSQGPELGRKLLGDFQVNDVAQIRMEQGTNDLTLARTNGLWRVAQRDDYPANFSQISQLLLKLRDLKIVQTEEVGAAQLARLDLAPPGQGTNAATLLEFDDVGGRPIRTLWLGKAHTQQNSQPSPDAPEAGWPDGRYVLTAARSTTVAVIGDPLSEVSPAPDQWLDKTFFQIEKPQSILVDFPEATNSWKLTRSSESSDWMLADANPGEKLDSSKASETAGSFSSPSFEDVATGLNPEQTGMNKPTRVEIKTFDGFDYSVQVGRKTDDNYYLSVHTSATLPKEPVPVKGGNPEQPSSDKSFPAELKTLQDKLARETALNQWVYSVPAWTVDPLLKTREQLLVPKPTVTQTNTPAVKSPLEEPAPK
ncbi:MAG TPA: DUF4340 domain-containing protein [Candidatus Sulfopaludibacter sp.]|nr:DUF4340 domain-containing protein [Candidatus Sulfopaludibacter sp.]